MKKLLTIALIYALMLGLTSGAFAQDEDSSAPALSVSGSIDAYYRANLTNSNDPSTGATMAPGSSFANLPGFSLGMANVILGMDGEKAGFVADLVFGPRGTDAVFGSTTGSSSVVNQLYAYWNVSDGTTLTFGNWNTFLGYEVISPTANYNYSTSYMFSYGPFSHSGLKADFTLSDDASLMLAIMNPTDATDFNPSGDYVLGAQLGVSGQYLNFILDSANDFWQIDFTGGVDLGETVFLGLNATKAKDTFTGAALYLQNSFTDSFSMGIRAEYFDDEAGVALTAGESVIDFTLTANAKVGDLTLIPEIRLDSFSADEVVADDASVSSSLSSFVLAAVYSF
ncbi:MAG: porin [Cyclobacteriaceae bacterium]